MKLSRQKLRRLILEVAGNDDDDTLDDDGYSKEYEDMLASGQPCWMVTHPWIISFKQRN